MKTLIGEIQFIEQLWIEKIFHIMKSQHYGSFGIFGLIQFHLKNETDDTVIGKPAKSRNFWIDTLAPDPPEANIC